MDKIEFSFEGKRLQGKSVICASFRWKRMCAFVMSSTIQWLLVYALVGVVEEQLTLQDAVWRNPILGWRIKVYSVNGSMWVAVSDINGLSRC